MLTGIVVFGVILVIAAVAGGVYAARMRAAQTQIESTPLVAIAALAPGEARVRVEGVARGTPTRSTFSGEEGLAFLFERWDLMRGERVKRTEQRAACGAFTVEDAGGSIAIDGEGADVMVATQPAKLATSGPGRVFGAGIMAANKNPAQATYEGIVRDGDRVIVVGTVVRRPDGSLAIAAANVWDGKR